MEMNEDSFLEELLALRREAWETNPSSTDHEINGCFFSTNTTWPTFNGLDSILPNTSTASYDSFSSSIDQPPSLDCSSFFAGPDPGPFTATYDPPTFPGQVGPEHMGLNEGADNKGNKNMVVPCKAEHSLSSTTGELELHEMPSPSFNIGSSLFMNNKMCSEIVNNNKNSIKAKKVEGQPSKNLMAERRRRKRLNDRLSMLRSVVPKISKMDRTSILGDTIDYMKELQERINNLQEEMDVGSNEFNVTTIFKDDKPNDVLVRNSPKFEVDRKRLDTRVEICCAGKPGLLLSTVTTLEALGLEVQQCVISCFNDFSLQASCFEEMEHKALISSEDIKQALFRNAGYGGRCL